MLALPPISLRTGRPKGSAARIAEQANARSEDCRDAVTVAQASDGGLSDMKTPSEDTSSDQPSPRSEVASDEICRRDEDRLERLSNGPTTDEAMRFLTELRCEKLRPELFRLTERLDYQAPTAADVAIQSPSSWVAPAQVGRWRVAC